MFAVLLGGGVAAAGFPPLSNAADLLEVPTNPLLIAFVPSVLIAALSCLAAQRLPLPTDSRSRSITLLTAAGLALLAGGCLSLLGSDAPRLSAQLLLVTLIAPIAMLWALLRADLPQRWLCAAFLATVCLFMLRADIAFFSDYGFPSGDDLFRAKFSNAPYDFHYYALKNPNQTAAFLLLPLGLAAFWAVGSIGNRRSFFLLSTAVLFLLVNLVMVYTRAAIAVGIIAVLSAILSLPAPRRKRIAAAAALMLLVIALISVPSIRDYFLKASDTSTDDASAVVRLSSTLDGGEELINHPITGVGLGRYGNTPDQSPAHSAVIQAGAELGVLGAVGALLILAWLLRTVWKLARLNGRLGGLDGGAAGGALMYWLYVVAFGGFTLGIATGYIAAWGMALALLGAVSARSLPIATAAAEPFSGVDSTKPRQSMAAARLLRFLVPVLLVIPAVAALSGDAEEDLTSVTDFTEDVALDWSFADGSNAEWTSFESTKAGRHGLVVKVDAKNQAYVLVSDPIQLTVGPYQVTGELRLLRGAVSFGVLDVKTGEFIVNDVFKAAGKGSTREVTSKFVITEPASTQIILSNGSSNGRSAWVVERIALRSDPDS